MSCIEAEIRFDCATVIVYFDDWCIVSACQKRYRILEHEGEIIVEQIDLQGNKIVHGLSEVTVTVRNWNSRAYSPPFGEYTESFAGYERGEYFSYAIQRGCIKTNIGNGCAPHHRTSY